MDMNFDKKFYLLVALVIAVIYLLELVDFNSLFNLTLDFSLVVSLAFLAMGGAAGLFYARSGDWNLFYMAAALILIGLISYLGLFGQLTLEVVAVLGWAVIIFLFVWRGSQKGQT